MPNAQYREHMGRQGIMVGAGRRAMYDNMDTRMLLDTVEIGMQMIRRTIYVAPRVRTIIILLFKFPGHKP